MDESVPNMGPNGSNNGDLNSFEIVNKADVEEINEEQEKPAQEEIEVEEWVDILGSGHIKKKILKKGEPDTRPQRGDLCVVSGFGKLEDDTIVETFDNLEVCVGDLELVHGMDYVLPLTEAGEEFLVEITARFGYGDKGDPTKNIPPNAKLFYSITLHSVLPDFDLAELSVEKRLDFGVKRKTRGNWFYSRGDISFAVQCYRRSLEFLDSANMNTNGASPELLDSLIKERVHCFNNLAQAQINLGSLEPALTSLDNVLSLDPNNIKAMRRKAKVLSERNEVDEAIGILKQAQRLLDTLESTNTDDATLLSKLSGDKKVVQFELKALYDKQKSNTAAEKEIYKKMFSKPLLTGKPDQEPDKKSGPAGSFNKLLLMLGITTVALLTAGGLYLRIYYPDIFSEYLWSLD